MLFKLYISFTIFYCSYFTVILTKEDFSNNKIWHFKNKLKSLFSYPLFDLFLSMNRFLGVL